MKDAFVSFVVFFMAFPIFFFCISLEVRGDPFDAPSSRAILRMGLHVSAFSTLDPHKAASTSDRILADMLFNGLIRYQPGDSKQMAPDLAVEIPDPIMVRGKQTWIFRLKKGIYFHSCPGERREALTARDVCRSFIKSADPERSVYAGGYEDIGVTVTGPYTLRFTVDPPQSPLLFLPKVANYAGGFIVKETVDENGQSHFRGTGPFQLLNEERPDAPDQGRVKLIAHDIYFRGKPLLDGVEIFFMPDASHRLSALLDGAVDIIVGEPDGAWLQKIPGDHGFCIDSFGVAETTNLYFNTTFPPFSDLRVRKAVAFALDRNRFLDHFADGLVETIFSPIPPYMPGGIDAHEVMTLGLDYERDLDKARVLMAEGGYPEGFSMDVVVSEVGSFYHSYQQVKQQLADIAIDTTLRVTDHATMHRLIRQNINPLVIYEAFRPNADEYLSRFFHSSAAVSTGERPATNFSHYSGIDRLIKQARLERFTSKQIKLWEYAQIKLLEEMVVFPLFSKKQIFVRRAGVDYGHPLISATALYPQFTEKTTISKPKSATSIFFVGFTHTASKYFIIPWAH